MRSFHIFLCAWLTVVHTVAADSTARPLESRLPVIFNQDSSEFFFGTFGPIEPETVDRYVDSLAGTGVTDLFICVNAQRTNFRSRAWESDWDGYNPELGDSQPFFTDIEPEGALARKLYKNTYAWSLTSVDYPERMLSRSHENGIRGWVSVRMNDAHYPKQPGHPYHSTFWREHPEWRLANTSLDYARPEVRRHYLNLVREVTERYDLDGLELDFMRHGYYFRPGEENAGSRVMTDFVREARAGVSQGAVRLRHPVDLAVRVRSRP